ncbi:MAG: FAD-dependent oxidoreductase [Chlamydiia bacterium]|nr:FAD-dependent oxidoreductase [Chlamydiia bacterium]
MSKPKIVIVGAGLAGLAAAKVLEASGLSPLILEQSDKVGGRVRTDEFQGFLLDRGFQVLLDSYPEIGEYEAALKLKPFETGARYFWENDFRKLNPFNPFRWNRTEFLGLLKSLKLFYPSENKPASHLFEENAFMKAFWIPFFRGVFLDPELSTRSKRIKALIPFFLKGRVTLPEKGMGELAALMAKDLKSSEIRLNTPVQKVHKKGVVLQSGEKLSCDFLLLGTELPSAFRLLGVDREEKGEATEVFYFSAPKDKVEADKFLWLDSRPESPVNNFSVLSQVQPSYAPEGQHLISATSVGHEVPQAEAVEVYLTRALKIPSGTLQFLKSINVPYALPKQDKAPPFQKGEYEGIFLAGELVDPPSINDAIWGGKKAAQAVIQGVNSP